MEFKKGNIPWNKGKKLHYQVWMKGKKHSKEIRMKMSESMKGRIINEETRKKISVALKGKNSWAKGKPLSEDHKQNISETHKRIGVGKWMKGREKYPTAYTFPKGENHYAWKGGITPINIQIRHSPEYRDWIKFVFKRDNYTCQICRQKGGVLNANHIKTFSDNSELRSEVLNGITLCKNCHFTLVNKHEKEWENFFFLKVFNKQYQDINLLKGGY